MKYAALGSTGIEVSRICLGCMGFGDPGSGQHAWTLGYEESAAIMRRALDEGITFFDTAMGYQNGTSEEYVGRALAANVRREDVVVATKFVLGGLHAEGITFFDTAMGYQNGTSEEYVGRALAANVRREDVVVATKFVLGGLHAPAGEEPGVHGSESVDAKVERLLDASLKRLGMDYVDLYIYHMWDWNTPPAGEEPGVHGSESVDAKVERLLDASLKRLGMDYVDLYIYHMWDWNTPIEELLPALDRQVRAGKIRALGISNCHAWQLAEANAIARANGWTPFASYQGHYNAIAREDEREMVPLAATRGIALTPYSALAGGRLYGWTPFASYQGHYNAIAREDEREMVPLAATRGIALTPYSALAGGRLSKHPGETSRRLQLDAYAHGKYDGTADVDAPIIRAVADIAQARGVTMTEKHPGETSRRLQLDAYAHGKYDGTADVDAPIIRAVADIAQARGVTMTEVALAWLLTKVVDAPIIRAVADIAQARGVTMTEVALAWLLTKVAAPVVGATKSHHIDGAVGACELELTPGEIEVIEAPYVPHAVVGVVAENESPCIRARRLHTV